MSSDNDKRRSPRIVTENLAGTMAFSLAADILNVSRGGLAIRTKHQLRVGSRYQIQIGGKEQAVEASGTVIRCRLKGTRKEEETGDFEPVYEAGIRFEPSLSEKTKDLLPVMARSASVQLAPRLFGRFSAQPESEATLFSDLEFEVKKISLSGLLAEAEGPPWSGESIDLEISLGDDTFTTAAQIVNSKAILSEDEDEQRAQYGIEFVDPETEALERLESFVLGKLETDF